MSVQVEKTEKNMAKLIIEVPEAEFEKAVQAAYMRQRKNIALPGFRKGKAPRKMIEKMYGAGVFFEEATDNLMPGAYAQAVDESGLEIVSRPAIDIVQLESGKPFIFSAEVAVKPEVTLGEYKGLEVPKADLDVTDEEILEELKKEQEKNSRAVDVDDRPVASGDMIKLDFEGFVDGEAFEGGKGTDYDLTIGSGAFIPGFEDQLIGAEIGKEMEVNVTFPENYQASELAGKPAVFKCTVNRISYKELPELDDEFAQEVSEFDTLDEYKADVRENLEEKKAASAKTDKENAVVDKAIENAQMDIPDAMLDTQVDQMYNGYLQRLQAQGIAPEQYMQFTGATPEALKDQIRPQALKQIQTRLVLEAIAEAEKIEPSEEKVEEELAKMAESYKMEVDKLKEAMGDYEMGQMKKDLAVQEAITLIEEAAVEV
ncbi:MAG: trigger factor [Lachnospiraceae bacterium]|nr:trigger factor [Lachnospiraceae bacterium]